MITLYHDPVSSNSWKVRLVLEEKKLAYEKVQFDVRNASDHKQPAYLEINPHGRVPAIVDDGFAIYDSTLINEYLEDAYPDVPLMARDAKGRARQRTLEDYRDNHFHVDFMPLLRELRDKPPGQADREAVGAATKAVTDGMQPLEEALGGQDYFWKSFSVADAAFVPNFAYLESWDIPIPGQYPRLKAWFERCQARPSYAAAYGL